MPPRCTRCAKSHSTPHAFLLSCSGDCAKSWHHRCHQPPVPDKELVARIKAFNDGDFENSIHAWLCRRCFDKNSKESHTNVQPPPQSSAATTLTPTLCVKYNLAPSWMHNRRPDMGKTSALPQKRTSRKVFAKNNLPRDSFNFSSMSWLQERRGS